MQWLAAIDPLYVLSGFLVGTLVGMTGVGGGSLMTPILVLLFHQSTLRPRSAPTCCSPQRPSRSVP